jgi:TonB family protein
LGQPDVYDAPEMADGELSPAADVWSLGVTLVEALTQRFLVWEGSGQGEPVLPETLPAPFLELARHCLRRDPQHRWTVADIVSRLQRPSPAPQGPTVASSQTAFAKWPYVASAVALGLVLAAMLAGPRIFNRHRDAQRAPSTEVKQPGGQLEPARKSTLRTDNKAGHTPLQSDAEPPAPTVGLVPGKVVHQVLPDVPRNARNTIQGKVRVGVRVRVDPSGGVAGAKLDSPGPSKYFAGLALKAARHWKFDPAKIDGKNVSSEWVLRFEFGKAGTKVLPVRAAPRTAPAS